ncbi:MAG: sugar transferase [Pseudomonadota bacterium]
MEKFYSPKEFLRIVERERVRTDRTGNGFSIVLFNFESPGKNISDMENFGFRIRKRVRCYDEIGWFEDNSLGVLVAETSFEQAHTLADEISRTVFPKALGAGHTVLSYPTHWSSAAKEAPRQYQISPCLQKTRRLIKTLQTPQNHMPLWKRVMDIYGSMLGLLFCAPVFAIIALYIKAVSPGPVFFSQSRVGFLGKNFNCFKFRTMHIHAGTAVHNQHFSRLMSSEAPMEKLDTHDARIIPFGHFLRKSGLDELPQLLNVIKGDMSLIGPRPCIPYEAAEYKLWQRKRFEAVPGITGLWQVNGKNRTTFNEMMRFDISYALKKNFLLDAQILVKTIPAVIDQLLAHKRMKAEKTGAEALSYSAGKKQL